MIWSWAERAPAAVGEKVTLTAQVAAAASVLPHVFDCVKSDALAPEIPILAKVRGALPVLLSVTAMAALVVLTVCDGNVTDAGEIDATGAAIAAPVPLRVTLCGLPVALSVI